MKLRNLLPSGSLPILILGLFTLGLATSAWSTPVVTGYKQLGQTIYGQDTAFFGITVATNDAGDRMAVNHFLDEYNGVRSGRGIIYEYDGSTWTEMQSIYGQNPEDYFGDFPTFSGDGSTVAFTSAVKDGTVNAQTAAATFVYREDSIGNWVQLGQMINQTDVNGQIGSVPIALSQDGNRILIFHPGYSTSTVADAGRISILDYDSSLTQWVEKASIVGTISGAGFQPKAFNPAGDRVLIAEANNVGNTRAGTVSVYDVDTSTNTWTQVGNTLSNNNTDGTFGTATDMNAAGDRIIVYNNIGISDSSIEMYQLNGATWEPMGSSFGAYFIIHVKMNHEGNRVAWSQDNVRYTAGANIVGGAWLYEFKNNDWAQVGEIITPESFINSQNFGRAMDLNAAGDRIIVGSKQGMNLLGQRAGHVMAFETSDTLAEFSAVHEPIYGALFDSRIGRGVSMNEAGNRILVSADRSYAAKVYEDNGTGWQQLGSDFSGTAGLIGFGQSDNDPADMNAAGDRVVIGAYSDDSGGLDAGAAFVFSYDSATSSWVQTGNKLTGTSAGDNFGISTAINASGNRIVVGAPYNSDLATSNGAAYVLEWDGSAWNQVGLTLFGENVEDQLGFVVDINQAGDIIALAANAADVAGQTDIGYVQMYKFNGTVWAKHGNAITGNAATDMTGDALSLNAAGDRVAISSESFQNSLGSNVGHVRIFEYANGAWSQMGSAIEGATAGEMFGNAVDLNNKGNRIIIGSKEYKQLSTDGDGSGRAVMYEFNGNDWQQMSSDFGSVADGLELGSNVALNGVGNRVALSAPYARALGESEQNETGRVIVYTSDSDNDSIDDLDEKNGPNNGDVNGDGIEDTYQQNFARSYNNIVDGFVMTEASGSCGYFTGIDYVNESDLATASSGFDFPLGLASFNIECNSANGNGVVTWTLDADYNTSDWQFMSYDANSGTYSNLNVFYGTTTSTNNATVTTVTMSVSDSGSMDNDSDAAELALIAGPAVAAPEETTTPAPESGGGGGSASLALLALFSSVLLGVVGVRRRMA